MRMKSTDFAASPVKPSDAGAVTTPWPWSVTGLPLIPLIKCRVRRCWCGGHVESVVLPCAADAIATADGGGEDAAQLRAALQVLQEELAGSHAEAATLAQQVRECGNEDDALAAFDPESSTV
jgi:hypothetical protein